MKTLLKKISVLKAFSFAILFSVLLVTAAMYFYNFFTAGILFIFTAVWGTMYFIQFKQAALAQNLYQDTERRYAFVKQLYSETPKFADALNNMHDVNQQDIDTVQSTQAEATQTLIDSFTGMQGLIQQQAEFITETLAKLSGSENQQHYALEVTELMQTFIEGLKSMSKGSMLLVNAMTEMSGQINAVGKLLAEVDSIS